MAFDKRGLDSYVQVNERIVKFYDTYPQGSLRAEIVELTETRVVMKAFAFRGPEDTLPAIGHSQMGIPGSTPYTRGSEIENCETSAWGRALAALGFEVKKGIASKEEVENKKADGAQGSAEHEAENPPVKREPELKFSPEQVDEMFGMILQLAAKAPERAALICNRMGIGDSHLLCKERAVDDALTAALQASKASDFTGRMDWLKGELEKVK